MASNETIDEIVDETANITGSESTEAAVEELVFTCQNLSNCHVVKYWHKLTLTEVSRKLMGLGLSRCPDLLRESVLKGLVHVNLSSYGNQCGKNER